MNPSTLFKYPGLAIWLACLSFGSQAQGLGEPVYMSAPKKITVFVAKKIVTMDPAIPSASAVAVLTERSCLSGLLTSLSRGSISIRMKSINSLQTKFFIQALSKHMVILCSVALLKRACP